MKPYKHTVQYYETDKMGVTHHSNYIRWMEEARIDFLKQIGWDFVRLEQSGIVSPVVDVSCQYINSTGFSEEVFIVVSVREFKGVKLMLHYDMRDENGTMVAEGDSTHCFLDTNGKPLRLARQFPAFYDVLMSLIEEVGISK